MNTTRLLVLGTVRTLGTAHGYAVRQMLADWQVQTWTNVRSGSVYHALGQLEKEGLLTAHDSVPGARGAERTGFSLTPAGEAEFVSLVEAALSSFELQHLSAGVAFSDQLPPGRAKTLLGALHTRLLENRDHISGLKANAPNDAAPPRLLDLLDIWIDYLGSTAATVARLRDRMDTPAAT